MWCTTTLLVKEVSFSLDIKQRYTFWSGLLGGGFLALSYFGTDQSQVQRYLSGESLRQSRLGLMVNAVCKIPMQFFILLLGTMVFVFYQFEPPPLFFNQAEWKQVRANDTTGWLEALERDFDEVHVRKEAAIRRWLAAKKAGSFQSQEEARREALAAHQESEELRGEARAALLAANPQAKTNDADYIFVTFILDYLPHGVIGLLIAAFFAATLASKAAELNALGSTTTIDFYRAVVRREASDDHYLHVSKLFTILWGGVALGFALFANTAENLIQAVNIIGSIFYGVVLGLFLVAFFLQRIGGTAVFWGALAAQLSVLTLYFASEIGYLWYNLIGCLLCIFLSLLLQVVLGNPLTDDVELAAR